MLEKTIPKQIPSEMPLIAVKNAVVFPIPSLPVPLSVGRARTLKAIELASDEKGYAFITMQLDPHEENPDEDGVHRIGTIARLLRLTRSTNEEEQELLIEGLRRGRIMVFTEEQGITRVEVEQLEDRIEEGPELDALLLNLKELATKTVHLSPRLPDELLTVIDTIQDPAHLCDLLATQLSITIDEKQLILEEIDLQARMKKVLKHLSHDVAVLEVSAKLRSEVKDSLDKHQREVYLREQMLAIQKALGENPEDDDMGELSSRIEKAGMPEQALKVARREVKRLARMSPQSSEYTVGRTYLDWLLDTPWKNFTEDNLDVRNAAELLEEDHYGLEKVKRRITEYLAVRKLKGDLKGPILCLVGPPGVGKTSLSKSIAKALGRKFVQSSLGGMRDEAEIRGHRRTYIGALPGRIIQGLKRAGTMNPVFILDEIDKLGNDVRGDPASALLEVLDPEQNNAFMDHYLDVPVDLSSVLFMATANRLDTIPPPLLDRMEVIEIPGYIQDEKLAIARRHLLPRELAEHGLSADQVSFDDDMLELLTTRYTREAGVRSLGRQIAAVLRSVARDIATEEVQAPVKIDFARVRSALGPERFFPDMSEDISTPGVAIGLAWTPVGGDILFIEATLMSGSGKLTLTGQLGEVMRESAQAAMSYIHAHAEQLGIDEAIFSNKNIHLHVPSGAIPKDGPSAGITLTAALTSLLTGRCLQNALAMTGEITLRGVVLPVGGIKEKVLAAHRAGIKTIILPKRNEGDLEEIPADCRQEMTFHLVDRIEPVLELALGLNVSSVQPNEAAPAPKDPVIVVEKDEPATPELPPMTVQADPA